MRLLKVATPDEAAWVLFVRPPAEPSVRVMVSVKPVSVRPPASRAVTAGWVVRAEPETEPAGWVVKASWVATTSLVTALAFTVDRLVPTPSSSLAVRVKLCWSAVAV